MNLIKGAWEGLGRQWLRSIWMDCFLLLPFCFLIASCGPDNDSPETDDGPAKVIVVGSQWYGHLPVFVGMEKEFFSKAGFDVEFLAIGKSMDRLNAISSGDAQFASLGEIAMLSAMSRETTGFTGWGTRTLPRI